MSGFGKADIVYVPAYTLYAFVGACPHVCSSNCVSIYPLIARSCHAAGFVVAGGTVGFHNDKLRCHRWVATRGLDWKDEGTTNRRYCSTASMLSSSDYTSCRRTDG